ncbi:MAG: DUF6152 family protein [Steroidobacteraceae bacterium]
MARRYLGIAALLLTATPCLAHHSFAMFDDARTVTLHGTVRQLQWTNPHCYLQVLVPSGGSTVEWSLEMNSPLAMYRSGWKPGSFKPGDTVTVVINPLKDGTSGGRLVDAIDANGRSLKNIGAVRHDPSSAAGKRRP